jgi:predicted ATP-grasp superfamily ATP-dependent carboligase
MMLDGMKRSSWPQAVVVGFELNGLGLARALKKRGVSCLAVAQPGWTPAFASQSVKRVYQCAEWQRECLVDTLLIIGRRLDKPGVLLLTKDESVLWISSAAAELAQYYRFALPAPDTVQLLMNKGRFYLRALEEGWPVPRGFLFEHEDQLMKVLPQLDFPAILKPQLRNSVYRRQPIPKAFKVTTPTELLTAYRRVAQYEPEVIVSEWIEGRENTLYSCRGFWDREAEPVVQYVMRKIMQWPVETGIGTAVEIPPPQDWTEPVEIANRVFRSVKMFGMADIEYKRHRDGRFLILEACGSRSGYTHELGPLNGYDVPWAAYRYLAFQDDHESPGPHAPARGVRETQPPPAAGTTRLIDVPRARLAENEYLNRGMFTETEIRDVFARPYFDMTYRADDPLPALLIRTGELLRRMARAILPRWVINAIRDHKSGSRKRLM